METTQPNNIVQMSKRDLYLANARGEFTLRTPIWIMRQAGRYLPDYLRVRETYSFEKLAKTPAAVAEVSAQPIEILDLDAAIIFSDILFVLEPLGIDLTFDPGPRLSPVLERPQQAGSYKLYDAAQQLAFVGEALVETRKRIGPDVAMLGFCGAPFTVFCYLCGLRGAKNFHKTIQFLVRYPEAGKDVLDLLAEISIGYLKMQIASGADAVQIFDTWAGDLSEKEYCSWSYPYVEKIVQALKADEATVSLYTKGSYHLLERIARLDVDIVNLDWKTPLPYAAEKLAPKTLQGNLNPHQLFGSPEQVAGAALEVLDSAGSYPGFIFNLGHGILPQTPVENVHALVETVHGYERKAP